MHRPFSPGGACSEEVVGVTGFEPATSWSQTRRSTKLSYTPRDCAVLYHARSVAACGIFAPPMRNAIGEQYHIAET